MAETPIALLVLEILVNVLYNVFACCFDEVCGMGNPNFPLIL